MKNLHKYKDYYKNNFTKACLNADLSNKENIKKLILNGINLVISKDKSESYTDLLLDFRIVNLIKDMTAELTPVEFMTIFPITKEFDGEKWGTKDYFYTIDYINKIGMNEKIGEDSTEFLFEYNNRKILLFNVKCMSLLSDINRYQGKPSLAEQWAYDNGIKTYTKHVDSSGKEYMLDSNGRTTKVSKLRPSYLRLVK